MIPAPSTKNADKKPGPPRDPRARVGYDGPMTAGTKIRPWAKLLDASEAILWAIDESGKLVHLSGGAAAWLGVDGESLVGRTCRAGVALSDDPLDAIAASLSPPPDLVQRGTSRLRVRPPSQREAIDVRYVMVAQVGTIAVAGEFSDRDPDPDLDEVVRIRTLLDEHRRFNGRRSAAITAGSSADSTLLQRRIALASRAQANALLVGPVGCGSEILAREMIVADSAESSVVHRGIDPAHVVIDGGVVDADLVDSTLMPTLGWLERSVDHRAGVIVRDLPEMPPEAQIQLAQYHAQYPSRMRIVGLCRWSKNAWATSAQPQLTDFHRSESLGSHGLVPALETIVGECVIPLSPLAHRPEDIPIIANAWLDMRSAKRSGDPLSISRECLDALVLYPWPGEVEELEAAMRQAASLVTGNRIGCEHLPLAIRSYRPGKIAGKPPIPSLDDSVRRHEAGLIRRAMEQSNGNRTEAAKQLGISRGRLLRKIDELNAEELLSE